MTNVYRRSIFQVKWLIASLIAFYTYIYLKIAEPFVKLITESVCLVIYFQKISKRHSGCSLFLTIFVVFDPLQSRLPCHLKLVRTKNMFVCFLWIACYRISLSGPFKRLVVFPAVAHFWVQNWGTAMQSTHGYYSHRLNMIKTSNEDFYRITSPFRTVVFCLFLHVVQC